MERKPVSADLLVAQIAARQHGLISLEQLRRAGLTDSAIRHRLVQGRLHRIYRGVYAVGHAGLTQEGRWKAATMAFGSAGVLSHRSAAELWGMVEPGGGDIHVSMLTPGGRERREGIRIHRGRLARADVTAEANIPVTRPQRTLQDLKAICDPGELRGAIKQAEVRGLPIEAAALIADTATSATEVVFLALCRRHRLPTPEVNARVGRYRVDFLWRTERLIVETDGERFHRGLVAAADDLERDRYLTDHGFAVIRVTYRDLMDRPTEALARVRGRLAPRRDVFPS